MWGPLEVERLRREEVLDLWDTQEPAIDHLTVVHLGDCLAGSPATGVTTAIDVAGHAGGVLVNGENTVIDEHLTTLGVAVGKWSGQVTHCIFFSGPGLGIDNAQRFAKIVGDKHQALGGRALRASRGTPRLDTRRVDGHGC